MRQIKILVDGQEVASNDLFSGVVTGMTFKDGVANIHTKGPVVSVYDTGDIYKALNCISDQLDELIAQGKQRASEPDQQPVDNTDEWPGLFPGERAAVHDMQDRMVRHLNAEIEHLYRKYSIRINYSFHLDAKRRQ